MYCDMCMCVCGCMQVCVKVCVVDVCMRVCVVCGVWMWEDEWVKNKVFYQMQSFNLPGSCTSLALALLGHRENKAPEGWDFSTQLEVTNTLSSHMRRPQCLMGQQKTSCKKSLFYFQLSPKQVTYIMHI